MSKKQLSSKGVSFRFNLRLLLLLLACLSVWLAWMCHQNNIALQERRALEFFQQYDCDVRYADQFDANQQFNHQAKPPQNTWLTLLFSEYPFRRVVEFKLRDAFDLKSLEHVSRFRDLRSFTLSDAKSVKSFGPIQNLKNLQRVSIFKSGVTDFSPLENCKQLETVVLSGDFDSVASLAKLRNVRSLDISAYSVTDFEPIGALKNLRSLSIHTNSLNSLTVLDELSELETLLVSAKQLTSIDGLQSLRKLKTLELYDVTALEDLSAIQGSKLENLVIHCAARSPDASVPPFPTGDRSGLEGLHSLKHLTFWHFPHRDFSTVRNLPALEVLLIDRATSLESLAGIEQMPKLQKLQLNECDQIQSLAGIEHVPSLQSLGCYDCRSLADISSLANLAEIQSIDFYRCEELAAGEFLLSMKPQAFTSDAFLNFDETKTDARLIEKLKQKYPSAEVHFHPSATAAR